MRFTEFTMDGGRYVAFGTFLTYQNVHSIEDDHLVQHGSFYPATTKFAGSVDVTDEGEATAAELAARYGRVLRLPERELERFRGRLAKYRQSAESHAENVAEERRVNVNTADPVLRIEMLDRFASAWEHGVVASDELVAEQTLEVADRVSRLSEEELANYEMWRRQLTSPLERGGWRRPPDVEPSVRVRLAAARAALEFAHRQP